MGTRWVSIFSSSFFPLIQPFRAVEPVTFSHLPPLALCTYWSSSPWIILSTLLASSIPSIWTPVILALISLRLVSNSSLIVIKRTIYKYFSVCQILFKIHQVLQLNTLALILTRIMKGRLWLPHFVNKETENQRWHDFLFAIRKCQSQELNPHCLTPKPMLSTSILYCLLNIFILLAKWLPELNLPCTELIILPQTFISA